MNRLLKYGVDALKPHFVDGRWRRPLISKRNAVRLRKEAIANGTYGSFDAAKGGEYFHFSHRIHGIHDNPHRFARGWDPMWDDVANAKIVRPFKLHKRERDREDRFKKIQEALKGMDAKIEAHRESLRGLKPKINMEYIYKKLAGPGR